MAEDGSFKGKLGYMPPEFPGSTLIAPLIGTVPPQATAAALVVVALLLAWAVFAILAVGGFLVLAAFWLVMRKHKSAQVKVDLVDRTYEGPANNIVVANCQFFGGGMKIAPKAAPTDGLLDIQVEHARKREAISIMPKIFKGEHLPHPDIEEYKRVRCEVTSDRPLLIEADGEVLGHTPARFEVLRDLIRLKV
mgnify:CR=1 FL=1